VTVDTRVATLSVADDRRSVVVTGDGLDDRAAGLFFRGVLGGRRLVGGWECPTRGRVPAPLVVRINTWLERHGYTVARDADADVAVERDIERTRSYQRARDAGENARGGAPALDTSELVRILDEAGWNSDHRALRDHQIVGALHGLSAINVANFSVPGAGKTASALAVAATHHHLGNVDLILVVGPLSSFRPWETEAAAALPGALRVKRVRGPAAQRRLAYTAVRPGDLLIMSYATAAHDRGRITELLRQYRPMLIVDESHRIKRFRGGTWAPALAEIARLCRIRMVLSGTPMPQSGRDLFTQMAILWPGHELTGPRDSFAAAVKRDLNSVLSNVMPFVSRTPKSALGLPDYTMTRHSVRIDAEHDEIYGGILDNLRRRVIAAGPAQADRLAALRRARPVRLLQAASDPRLLARPEPSLQLQPLRDQTPDLLDRIDSYALSTVPAKMQAALQLLTDIKTAGGKCVVWSNFLGNLDRMSRLVADRLELPTFQVDGRIPTGDEPADDQMETGPIDSGMAETREVLIERFLSTEGPAVLLANPASCSESISLHRSCRNAIYLDRTYDCALWLQSIDRIHRLGLPPDALVSIYVLLATRADGSPTADGLADAALLAKEQAMRVLLDGADIRPLADTDDPAALADGTDEDLALLLRYLLGEDIPAPPNAVT
jgi:SNF2 family DNA or RNA helicase